MPRRKKAEEQQETPTHLVDTNVILRFLIGDDPAKAARAAALMGRVEHGVEIIEIPGEVLTEAVWTLESFYKVPRAATARNLAALLSFAAVRVGLRHVLIQALQYYARSNADFVDCLLAARSRHRRIPVYTFDERDFNKLGSNWEKS